MTELLLDDATALYAEKEASVGDETLRDIERRVMLSVIDQHWREHLYEMDYLQEGINLRAMGQQDPLSEWQREGFDMFEAMMGQIEDDFVQYVFHLQVVVDDEPQSRRAQRAVQRAERPGPGFELDRERDGGRAAAWRSSRRRTTRTSEAIAADEPVVPGAGPGREDAGPQRAVLLREWQEVQAVPRSLNARLLEDLADRRAPRRTRRTTTSASTRPGTGSTALEAEASAPDLWDDPDRARKVSGEFVGGARRRRARRRARAPGLRRADAVRARA